MTFTHIKEHLILPKVTSSGGNETRSAQLAVIELPYAPSSVQADRTPNKPKSVRVIWTPTFDGNSPIEKFIIQKREVPSEGERQVYAFFQSIICTIDLELSWEINERHLCIVEFHFIMLPFNPLTVGIGLLTLYQL